MEYMASCAVVFNSFIERENIFFKAKKYQDILRGCDTDEYGPDEAIRAICESAAISGADPVLVIETWMYNCHTNHTKDRKRREVRWSKYKLREVD